MTEPLIPTWGGVELPQCTSFDYDDKPIQSESRMWDASLRVDKRGDKLEMQMRWDGADSGDLALIELLWFLYSGQVMQFVLPNGKSFSAIGVTRGKKVVPRYNKILRHWRYQVTINLDQV